MLLKIDCFNCDILQYFDWTIWYACTCTIIVLIIHLSSIDKGGMAERNGLRLGDQLIDVNGIPFDNISHHDAVDVIKEQKHLILTLRVRRIKYIYI